MNIIRAACILCRVHTHILCGAHTPTHTHKLNPILNSLIRFFFLRLFHHMDIFLLIRKLFLWCTRTQNIFHSNAICNIILFRKKAATFIAGLRYQRKMFVCIFKFNNNFLTKCGGAAAVTLAPCAVMCFVV